MPQGWPSIAPQELWPWLLIATGVIALGVIVLIVSLIMRQRDPLSRSPSRLTPAQQRTLERDLANLINDLSEMARDVGTQLDARAGRLERLIRDADERLDRLEQLVHPATIEPTSQPIAPSPLAAHPAISPIDEADPRHAEIYTLADEGLPLPEIAQRLHRPSGEVELILALRPRRAG